MIAHNYSPQDALPWSAGTSEVAETLWRVNAEYRARLSRAQHALELLVQLLHARGGAAVSGVAGTLQDLQTALHSVAEAHREWRYRYFYDAGQGRRMVQDELSVNRALAAFGRIHRAHQHTLAGLFQAIDHLPRPEAPLTSVANGDLWKLARQALVDLADFDDTFQKGA